jgi:hypothetical protein
MILRGPCSATEHHQLDSTLVGNSHPGVVACGRFLHMYENLEMWLESELDHACGRRLGPALVVFHVQLALHNWMICQLDVAKMEQIDAPDFCQDLHILEVQKNLMWLPAITNVPALLDLRVATRASATNNVGSGSVHIVG